MTALTLFTSFVSDFEYNSKMTHTYSLNFEKSIVSASSVHGPRTRCKKAIPKCYEFFTKDLENKTGENVPIVPAKRRCLPWLFGPATSLITRSIIYPCTKYMYVLPPALRLLYLSQKSSNLQCSCK
jgi:hypothetical protein